MQCAGSCCIALDDSKWLDVHLWKVPIVECLLLLQSLCIHEMETHFRRPFPIFYLLNVSACFRQQFGRDMFKPHHISSLYDVLSDPQLFFGFNMVQPFSPRHTRPTKRREAHPKKQVSPSSTSGSPNHPWQGIKQRNKWGKTVKFGSKINLFECRMKKLVVIWHYAHGSCLETWMVKSTKSIVKLPVVNWYHASPFWPNSWMLDALPTSQLFKQNHMVIARGTSKQWNIAAQVVQRRQAVGNVGPMDSLSTLPRDPEAGGPLKTVLLPHQSRSPARRFMEKCGEGLDKERSRPWLDPDQIHSIMIRINTVKDV